MSLRRIGAISALTAGVLVLGACGSAAGGPGYSAKAPAKQVVKEGMAMVAGHSEQVLTGANGRTLYWFTPDAMDSVTCTGSCAGTWPPLRLPSGSPGGPAMISSSLGTTTGPNGRQVTFKGHPLYTYSGDSSAGQANGQGLFGKWFVVTPSLAPASGGAASPSPSSSQSSGGYGY